MTSSTHSPEPRTATSGFLAKAARLASGHAAGYAVTFAISPLLARLYSPEAFGIYAIFVLCVGCLGPVASLRFDQAIALVNSRRSAMVLSSLALAAGAVVTLVLLALTPAMPWLLSTAGVQAVPWTLVALTVNGIACLAVYQIVAGLGLRETRYKLLASMRVCYAVASSIAHLAIPLLGGSTLLGLGAGQSVGFAAGALFGCLALKGLYRHRWTHSWSSYRKYFARYRSFAQYGVPATMASNLGIHLPALLIAALFGLEAAGIFSFAQRVFLTPLTLVANSLSRVFLAEASKLRSGEELQQHFDSIVRTGLLVSLPGVGLLAVVAPWAFPLVFGSEWALAGWVCVMLAPMTLGVLISQICSPAFDVSRRQDLRLRCELATSACIAIAIWIVYASGGSFLVAVAASSLAATVGYGALVVTARNWAGQALEESDARPSFAPQRQAA